MPRPPVRRHWQNKASPKRRVQIPDQAQTRQALQRKLSDKPVGKRPQDSDDSDELITSKTIGGGRKRQEIYGSGAVAKGDKPGTYPTRSQRTRSMRDDTEELLSSRSTSRAPSLTSSRSPTKSPEKTLTSAKSNTKWNKQQDTIQTRIVSAKPIVHSSAPTPRAGSSIIAGFKPRKRQASILQVIENDSNYDSTGLSLDDSRVYLADETSTPKAPQEQVDDSLHTAKSSSLKRKRGQIEPESSARGTSPVHAASSVLNHISPPSRSQSRKLHKVASTNDDIMAPPESSDDEEIDEQPQDTRTSSDKVKPVAPTTQQLQSLMPSKKRAQPKRQQMASEFDIPRDASDDAEEAEEDENDHSAFLPSKSRSKKAQKRPQRKKQPAVKLHKTKTKVKDKSRSTNTHTPSPVRLRTPLPLSTRSQAKSGLQQDIILRETTTNQDVSVASPIKGQRKRFGGTRRQAAGKENQPVLLSEEPLDRDDHSRKAAKKSKAVPSKSVSKDATAWKKKWAAIDDFSLDFEDVSVSTNSSPPS